MDFDLTDDQLALRDGASDVLDDLAAPERVRAPHHYRCPVRRRPLGGDGRAGLARGRSGRIGAAASGSARWRLRSWSRSSGRHAAPVPFVPTVLALDAFATAGDEACGRAAAVGRRARVRRLGPGRAGAVRAVGRCRDRARRRRRVRARPHRASAARARDGSHARARLVAVRSGRGASTRWARRAHPSARPRRNVHERGSARKRFARRSTCRSSTRRTACSSASRSDPSKR